MTYKQYLAKCRRLQLAYIAAETKRYQKLEKLWYDYKAKASKLGIHPLDRSEIRARFDQLRDMAARIDETHGDTPGIRALWEARQREAAVQL